MIWKTVRGCTSREINTTTTLINILYHSVIVEVFITYGELGFLKNSDSRTHWNAHFMQPLFGKVGQFDHSNFLLIE